MNFIEFTFQSFWHFIGMFLLLVAFVDWSYKHWCRFLRFWILLKHGYPPEHCDADGDQLIEEEEEEQTL